MKKEFTYQHLKKIFYEYNLSKGEIQDLWDIIRPIYKHTEFQKRLNPPYYHHEKTTLGEHIIRDAIITYKICIKKKMNEDIKKRAVLIAMFHDLYTKPWMQKNPKKYLQNFHAFTHPIEAIINVITWFPNFFVEVEDAEIIIDGVLHHMFPCPLRSPSLIPLEINNKKEFNNLPYIYKHLILKSLRPSFLRSMTWRESIFIEGRIVSRADKISAMYKDLSFLDGLSFCKNVALAVLKKD